MKLTFDRRYDKWQYYKETRERCANCMDDAPYEYCCKHQCGKQPWCTGCTATSQIGEKLCEK